MMIMRVMQMVLNLIMMKMVRRRNMILLRKTAEGRIVLEIKMKSSQACLGVRNIKGNATVNLSLDQGWSNDDRNDGASHHD